MRWLEPAARSDLLGCGRCRHHDAVKFILSEVGVGTVGAEQVVEVRAHYSACTLSEHGCKEHNTTRYADGMYWMKVGEQSE